MFAAFLLHAYTSATCAQSVVHELLVSIMRRNAISSAATTSRSSKASSRRTAISITDPLIQDLETKLARYRREIKELEGHLDEAQAQYRTYRHQKQEAEHQLKAWRLPVHRGRDAERFEDLFEEEQALRRTIARASARMSTVENEIFQMSREHTRLERKIEETRAKLRR